uniref:Expressed conserved protein n=1 Tax=Echinococcus granulosus TaxID=6210 RepID=A0A068X221_ECHGR|nr:expressed conserved protein [Echinococcus granulosus]
MLLVCIVGVSLLLLLVCKRHFVREAGLVLQAENSKRRKKKAKRKSRQRVNPSNGQAPSCGTHEGIVNVAHGSFEEMLEEEPGGADEDESGEEAAEDGDDLNAGADVSVDGAVAHDQEGDSEEQVDARVTESPPQRKTSKREKHGNGKSANRGRGHPSQYHVQPSVDPSIMKAISEAENELKAAKLRLMEQEANIRLARREKSRLQKELKDCHAWNTHLRREISDALQKNEKEMRSLSVRDRQIQEVMMSNIEKKDNELRKLHSSVNKIVQEVFSYDQDLISNPEDPVCCMLVAQIAAMESAFSELIKENRRLHSLLGDGD